MAFDFSTSPLMVRIAQSLAVHHSATDPVWVQSLLGFTANGNPTPKRHEPWGNWVNDQRREKCHSARLLALQGVGGYQHEPEASTKWLGRAILVQYGQTHGHTCPGFTDVFDGFKIGHLVNHTRCAFKGTGKGSTKPADAPFYTQGLRGWAMHMPTNKPAAIEAFRHDMQAMPVTDENLWWQPWATAYRWRHHHVALGLLTPDELRAKLGSTVWGWLVPMVAAPHTIAAWSGPTAALRREAIAMLGLMPIARVLKADWLPEGSVAARIFAKAGPEAIADLATPRTFVVRMA